MARITDLTDHDRYRIAQARRDLAAARQLDKPGDQATAHMLGRLEVALEQLLEVFGEAGDGRD